jgi:hypothetical protein
MNRTLLGQKAAVELRCELLPGEQIVVGSVVTSDSSRWGGALLGLACLALAVVSLLSLLGPLPGSPFIGVPLPVLGLGFQFLPRPMYVAVTDRRLICSPLPRFRGSRGRPALAMPLADLRILSCRRGKFGASIRCEFPGRRPIVLHWAPAARADYASVEIVLSRSGAFAKLDPPLLTAGFATTTVS